MIEREEFGREQIVENVKHLMLKKENLTTGDIARLCNVLHCTVNDIFEIRGCNGFESEEKNKIADAYAILKTISYGMVTYEASDERTNERLLDWDHALYLAMELLKQTF